MNKRNLVPNEARTPSERRANASKAGKASGKARAERKALKEVFETLLTQEVKDPENEKRTLTGAEYLGLSMFKRAAAGDVRAFKIIAEIMGEYKQEIKLDQNIEQKIEKQLTPQEAKQLLENLEKSI